MYSTISYGSEGGEIKKDKEDALMYSKFSHGSEGNINQSLHLFLLMYSMYSHGSESKYAIAPLVLLVRENTIL